MQLRDATSATLTLIDLAGSEAALQNSSAAAVSQGITINKSLHWLKSDPRLAEAARSSATRCSRGCSRLRSPAAHTWLSSYAPRGALRGAPPATRWTPSRSARWRGACSCSHDGALRWTAVPCHSPHSASRPTLSIFADRPSRTPSGTAFLARPRRLPLPPNTCQTKHADGGQPGGYRRCLQLVDDRTGAVDAALMRQQLEGYEGLISSPRGPGLSRVPAALEEVASEAHAQSQCQPAHEEPAAARPRRRPRISWRCSSQVPRRRRQRRGHATRRYSKPRSRQHRSVSSLNFG